jgi:hypothetical protein
MAIGDPHTRPEEETVFVPNSYAIARDAQDWEACALVPWAMHLPPHAGARDIECLITEELNLQLGDLAVTLHQHEPYLIRFVHQHHAAAAEIRGRFHGRGIDICVWRWRSLTHALGLRIFYRVRLCLDGIPTKSIGRAVARSDRAARAPHLLVFFFFHFLFLVFFQYFFLYISCALFFLIHKLCAQFVEISYAHNSMFTEKIMRATYR